MTKLPSKSLITHQEKSSSVLESERREILNDLQSSQNKDGPQIGFKASSEEEKYQEGLMVDRSPSGHLHDTIQNRRQLNKSLEKKQVQLKIENYDKKILKGRGSSSDVKRVGRIAAELLKTTKNQENRSNVFQLLREGSLSLKKDPKPANPIRKSQFHNANSPNE